MPLKINANKQFKKGKSGFGLSTCNLDIQKLTVERLRVDIALL